MSLVSKVPPIGQKRQAEMLKSATTLSYLETPQGSLQCHFFVPSDFEPGQRRPVVLFLHGGFWDVSMPTQFVPQCLHFATRGAIAIAAETRVESIHGTGPIEALEDVEVLLGWLAKHADNFGLDLDKVVIGGASGGAWLALQEVMPKPAKDPAHPIQPAAVLLFSGVFDTMRPGMIRRFPDKKSGKKGSPLKLLRKGLPPMILFHGKQDRVAPYEDAVKFARIAKRKRNRVELVDFEKAEHSFFNFNVSDLYYELTLKAADAFLVEQGLLPEDEFAVD